MTATTFESARHASKAASDHAAEVVSRAPADRDEARRYFKREARRSEARFEEATDETARTFEAVFCSKMKAWAESAATREP